MQPCSFCNLSTKQGVKACAIISFVYCLIILTMMIIYRDETTQDIEQAKYIGGVCSYVLMVILSIMLYFGATKESILLCVPWLIYMVFETLFKIGLMVTLVVAMLNEYSGFYGTTFFFSLLSTLGFLYCVWIVITFIMEVKGGGGISRKDYQPVDREDGSYKSYKSSKKSNMTYESH